MILRLTQKLGSRLKAGSLKPMPMDEAPIADWTGHLFFFNRTPYIILCNTATLYSAVLFGNGITNDSIVIPRVLTTLRAAMEADGLEFAYERFIVPRTGLVSFASSFSRSVTGSMNELVAYAKVLLSEEDVSPYGLSGPLNDMLLSSLRNDESRGYGRPREAFRSLIAQSRAP